MLNELKFVQGAVAKKDLLPAMTHFRIENGNVRSYNGVLALSSPLAFDIDCTPKASALVKAISNCRETVSLAMTKTGKLQITSGKFKAFIDCIEGPTHHVEPSGEVINFDGEILLKGIKAIYPFIGDDASRPWVSGMLVKDSSLFATNNTALIQYWIGGAFVPPFVINIPKAAIKEIIRIDEEPTHAQLTESSICFHYSDGKWILSSLLSDNWPELTRILDKETNPKPINSDLFEGLKTLKSYGQAGSRVYLKDGELRTSLVDGEGATYSIDGLEDCGCYNMHNLLLLADVATHADFKSQEDRCMFFGERLRGAMVGMRPE